MAFGVARLRTAQQLLAVIGHAGCVLFTSSGGGWDGAAGDVSSAIGHCLSGSGPFVPCVNGRAMAALERTDRERVVRLDPGLEIVQTEDPAGTFGSRDAYSFGDNPYNVGAVFEAASLLLSRRTFFWDLSGLNPGLRMRIGPTYNGGGTIDFVVDTGRKFDDERNSLGLGQMIFKRFVLPTVLATRISIASVVPLMFAAIFFLTKNAFLLSKIALLVTSVTGYGSWFLHYKSKPIDRPFGGAHLPILDDHPPPQQPIGGHHDGFFGDIRGDKLFYGDSDGFQQISSSRLSTGVNHFPSRADHDTSENSADTRKNGPYE